MNHAEELDKLTERAKARMDRDAKLGRHCLPSPFDYLTDEEKERSHWLKMQLPTMVEERQMARMRIREKTRKRRKTR